MSTLVVILAGGKGTRLLAHTGDSIPKPLVLVAGQPFLYWQLRDVAEQGFERVLLLLSHLGSQVEDHFRKNPVPGLTIEYIHETEPLGTGGALRHALPNLDSEFVLLNGDSFLHMDLKTFVKRAKRWPAAMVALTDPSLVPVPANLRLLKDQVIAVQKGAGLAQGFTAVDAGVYWLTREVIAQGPEGRFDLESYWPELLRAQKLGAFPTSERFFDIGTPERLQQFEEHVHDYF
jgi:NDP-sugar pyrophosphorylase family protein